MAVGVTKTLVDAYTFSFVLYAFIYAVPYDLPVTTPFELTVATVSSNDFHVQSLWVFVPLLYTLNLSNFSMSKSTVPFISILLLCLFIVAPDTPDSVIYSAEDPLPFPIWPYVLSPDIYTAPFSAIYPLFFDTQPESALV